MTVTAIERYTDIRGDYSDEFLLDLLIKHSATRKEEYEAGDEADPITTMKRLEYGITLNHNLSRPGTAKHVGINWRVDQVVCPTDTQHYGYSLKWNSQLVYVGITSNPGKRALNHMADKRFDEMTVHCRGPRTYVRDWEIAQVAKHLPVLNRELFDEMGRRYSFHDYVQQRETLRRDNPDLFKQ